MVHHPNIVWNELTRLNVWGTDVSGEMSVVSANYIKWSSNIEIFPNTMLNSIKGMKPRTMWSCIRVLRHFRMLTLLKLQEPWFLSSNLGLLVLRKNNLLSLVYHFSSKRVQDSRIVASFNWAHIMLQHTVTLCEILLDHFFCLVDAMSLLMRAVCWKVRWDWPL